MIWMPLLQIQMMGWLVFVSSDGNFKIEPILRLPLNIRLENLVLEEVTSIDLSILEDVRSGHIKWTFINAYPMTVESQAYLLKNSMTIDSFFESPIVVEGADGSPTENSFTFFYGEDKINQMLEADSVTLTARFNTAQDQEFYQLRSDQSVTVKAGMQAKLK